MVNDDDGMRMESVEFSPRKTMQYLHEVLSRQQDFTPEEFFKRYLEGMDESVKLTRRAIQLRLGMQVIMSIAHQTIQMIDRGFEAHGRTIREAKILKVDKKSSKKDRQKLMDQKAIESLLQSLPKEKGKGDK